MTEIAGLRLDARARLVTVGGQDLELSPKEFDVLAVLVADQGAMVTRAQLMAGVWGEDWYGSTRTLDVHMTWLRSKLVAAGWTADAVAVAPAFVDQAPVDVVEEEEPFQLCPRRRSYEAAVDRLSRG